jgi:hypothetical protein
LALEPGLTDRYVRNVAPTDLIALDEPWCWMAEGKAASSLLKQKRLLLQQRCPSQDVVTQQFNMRATPASILM